MKPPPPPPRTPGAEHVGRRKCVCDEMRQRAEVAERALEKMMPDAEAVLIPISTLNLLSDKTTKGWRAYNRLSAAVSRHLARSQPDHPAYRFPDDADDDLHRAHVRILRDIGPMQNVKRVTHHDGETNEDEPILRGGCP